MLLNYSKWSPFDDHSISYVTSFLMTDFREKWPSVFIDLQLGVRRLWSPSRASSTTWCSGSSGSRCSVPTVRPPSPPPHVMRSAPSPGSPAVWLQLLGRWSKTTYCILCRECYMCMTLQDSAVFGIYYHQFILKRITWEKL